MSPRAALLLLALLSVPAASAQSAGSPAPGTPAAIAELGACVPRLDPELDVGLGRIELLCPRLVTTLEASGVAALLPSDWKSPRSELSVGGLRALRRALAAPPPSLRRVAPDTEVLRGLIDQAGTSASTGRGRWARFKRWLGALVERLGPQPAASTPSRHLGAVSLPQRVWRMLGYAAVAVLLAFTVWLVRAELGAAGLIGRRRDAGHRHPREAAVPDADASLCDVALLERPGWLLRRLARALQQLGRLPAAGALTPRELAGTAQLEAPADREPLQAIAAMAERVRFAAQPPSPRELEPAIAAAVALLRRLDTSGAAICGDAAPVARRAGVRR